MDGHLVHPDCRWQLGFTPLLSCISHPCLAGTAVPLGFIKPLYEKSEHQTRIVLPHPRRPTFPQRRCQDSSRTRSGQCVTILPQQMHRPLTSWRMHPSPLFSPAPWRRFENSSFGLRRSRVHWTPCPRSSYDLREFLDELLPFICIMCNVSLQQGLLPESQKAAIVTPILKKHDLDPDDVKSYRPISNLTFISKVIERIVASQLTSYLQMNRLLPDHQSAYRQGHSTETALLEIFSDILDAADSAQVTLLGLLDLSAAFDTVDHDILLTRLQKSYGVGGTALAWISSFIQGRQQSVTFNGHQSTRIQLKYGVPQGSVLGPLLFILYTSDVISIAASLGVGAHSYADDSQLYLYCLAVDLTTAALRLAECIKRVEGWMKSNRLKLNSDKTQFLWLGSR